MFGAFSTRQQCSIKKRFRTWRIDQVLNPTVPSYKLGDGRQMIALNSVLSSVKWRQLSSHHILGGRIQQILYVDKAAETTSDGSCHLPVLT